MTTNIRPAGIEYVGVAGSSADCQDAVIRMLQFHDRISKARILSSNRNHCLLLTVNEADFVAVKSGFASGYLGEGPRTFATVLQLLVHHGIVLEECDISEKMLDRLDQSALTGADLDQILAGPNVRPSRWANYIEDGRMWEKKEGMLWHHFRPVMPFALIDARLADLALSFQTEPSDSLLKGFRRLEDIVRRRTGLTEIGNKLFSQAFQGERAKLEWPDLEMGETNGRASLFIGTYMAHRNPRAHRELDDTTTTLLSEFLLLNHLFVLERASVAREIADDDRAAPN